MPERTAWTPEENAVIVRAYLEMLRLELLRIPFNKAEINRSVVAKIGRSRGSIEYKFQNVSWALYEINHPFVDGYKPAKNIQDALRGEVQRQLEGSTDLVDLAIEAARAPSDLPRPDLAWAYDSAPTVEWQGPSSHFTPRHVDFVRLEAENRKLGRAGEFAVLQRERRWLSSQGLDRLASKVEHVSETRGDGAGYDILSFARDGEPRFIEVKTTRRGRHWPMLASRTEVAFSEAESARFELHRVHDFQPERAGLYVLKGAMSDTCRLTAETFRALPA